MQANMLPRGDRIGGYQVERRLRAGGMATLFLARRTGAAGFTRHAAIKVIHPHLSEDPQFVAMFIDEARISSVIDHPNVVHVEEFGEEDGLFFLVMEYVDGCSAGQLVRALAKHGNQMPVELAVHIAIKVAEGLHAAHETCDIDGKPLGIVHRDVSPSNVLLSAAGHVKIIDFGIAKARGRLANTQTRGSLKGKLHYMAPEQAQGQIIDRRADIYSLGIVLWELLAGEHAFVAENEVALLAMISAPTLRPLEEIRDDVPPEVVRAIRMAAAPRPDDRPADAYEFARLLDRACPQAMRLDHRRFARLIGGVAQRANSSLRRPARLALGSSFQPLATADTARESCEQITVETGGVPKMLAWVSEHRRASAAALGIVCVALGLSLIDRPEALPRTVLARHALVSPALAFLQTAVTTATVPAPARAERVRPAKPAARSTGARVAAVERSTPTQRRAPGPRRTTEPVATPKPPPPPPPIEPEIPDDGTLRVDGVTIADHPYSSRIDVRPAPARPATGPSRVGKTPIAEGFDE